MDNKKITSEDVERMCQLYDRLGTYKAVAEKMGISASTVSKYIKESGYVRSTEQGITNNLNFSNDDDSLRYKSFYALGLVICGLVGVGSLIGALAISRTEEFHTDELYNFMGSSLLILSLLFIIVAIISGVAYKRAVDKEKELQKEYGDEYVNEQREISRLFTKRFITITLTLILVITIPLVLILTIDRPSSDEVEPGHCIICDKKATNTFQGSEYCKKHYDKAVKWAIDNLGEDD